MPCARMGLPATIALGFKDSPEGLRLAGGVVPAGQDRVRVTLAVAPWLADSQSLCLEGRATINGKEVVRTASRSRRNHAGVFL